MAEDGRRPLRSRLPDRALDPPVPTLLLSALAGVVVFAVAATLFPYHSSNHDEAVYLQAASMLLEGRLAMDAGAIAGSVRPWFFVQDGGRLYPKYSPVVPAVFAVGTALGEPRVSLALVAAAVVGLTSVLGRLTFDRPTGLLAGLLVLCSPGFLFVSATFLPYAPTTALNLAFAVAYVLAIRRHSVRWAALAGAAVGLAFFARPYTAVLFAAPFVGHASWTLWATRGSDAFAPTLRRQGTTAALGTAGVLATLGYNVLMTGDPLLFPYQAFAPQDGLGFGRRRILTYERTYTPALAVRANVVAVWYLLTRWSPLAPLGAVAAALGVGATLRRTWRPSFDPTDCSPVAVRWLLLGALASVAVGNLFFWGTLNTLADVGDPTDGLVALFGPFYHFDWQPILGLYGAWGSLALGRHLRGVAAERWDRRRLRAIGLATLVALAPLIAVVAAPSFAAPADRHAAYTERYESAYEPFRNDPPENAVVFLPPAYGEWLNHPFQTLRNDPGLDGPRVYAVHRGPADFDVVDAYPDRQLYRYTYNGDWSPDPSQPIRPRIVPVDVAFAERLTARTTVSVPDPDAGVRVAIETDGGRVERSLSSDAVGDELAVDWSVGPEGATLAGANGTAPIGSRDEVRVSVTLTAPRGATLTYSERVSVRRIGGGVQALWPPRTSVCTLVADCGREGRYLPDRPDLYPEGTAIETALVENGTVSVDGRIEAGPSEPGAERCPVRTGAGAALRDTPSRSTSRWRSHPRWGPASSHLSARGTRSVPRGRRTRG